MKVFPINGQSPYLERVKQLGRRNSATLGFFPDGAFVDYAKNKKILVAVNDEDFLLGYLAYRVTKMRTIIVHLCVDNQYSGRGIAKQLVVTLSQIEHRCQGIGLRCRRDFAANNFWPKVGFIPLQDKPGRSLDPSKLLTFWWLDHNHPTLFSHAINEEKQTKLLVVIDANIFFDFLDDKDLDSKESKSLLADWLPDNFILSVTDELFNEINRQTDSQKRNSQLSHAQGFYKLESQQDRVDSIYRELSTLYLPQNPKPSDISDIRQLSHALASDVQAFITRDNRLLAISEDLYQRYHVNILRPCDFVVRLDELENEKEYAPARLAGSLLNLTRVKSGQTDTIVSLFKNQNESKAEFQRLVRDFLANPNEYQCWLIEDTGNPVGLLIYRRTNRISLEVVLLRLLPHPLLATLVKHIVQRTIYVAGEEGRIFITFRDSNISDEVTGALVSKGFIKSKEIWTKACFAVVETSQKILLRLELLSQQCPNEKCYIDELRDKLNKAISTNNRFLLFEIEKALWPAKIIDLQINNYIIPIKPGWALNLFDENMANQTLFGAKPELALNCENVFYRSVKPIILSSPARILWYVSKHKEYANSMQLRACSYLEDVIIGAPKELFRRFRRLGIYEWDNIVSTVGGDLDQHLMALKFNDTENFKYPLTFKGVQKYMKKIEGRTNNIQSPVAITSETFITIYADSMKREASGDNEKSNNDIYPA